MADENEPRFAIISEDFIDNLLDISIPRKTKKATKYGIKIFNGKNVFKHIKNI